jgi:hypothetical protein
MKRKRLAIFLCLIVALISAGLAYFAPKVGQSVSQERLKTYFEGRLARGIDDKFTINGNIINDDLEQSRKNNHHYLGDVQRINSPFLVGHSIKSIALFVLGASSLTLTGLLPFTFRGNRKREQGVDPNA